MPRRERPKKVLRRFLQKIGRTAQGQINGILRRLFVPRRRQRSLFSRSGYIMPVVIALLVVLSMVGGSMLFRSTQRSMQVTQKRQEQVITNASTPAIDRAKAKLEYIFSQDPRLPGGIPPGSTLQNMLINEPPVTPDPYTLPDEERLDINEDGNPDSAWAFQRDVDGDGTEETVAYSILTASRDDTGTITLESPDQTKAEKLVVRNGPMRMASQTGTNAGACSVGVNDQGGWFPIAGSSNSAILARTFQVDGVVVKDDEKGRRLVTTLEMQQQRQADKGNKWGAWFRNDLEIFPGPQFNWNGAIHTDGNLIFGSGTSFKAFLISSPKSCLYIRENSEITVTGNYDETTFDKETGEGKLLGQIVAGSMKENNFSGGAFFDIHGPTGPSETYKIESGQDSVRDSNPKPADPQALSLDPLELFTTNKNKTRGSDETSGTWRDSNWKTKSPVVQGRIYNDGSDPPYVDDTYRADNRYGPKPKYSKNIDLNSKKVGEKITSSDPNFEGLTRDEPLDPEEPGQLGYDGYWERRARREGLRVIVGQRLELGNANVWEGTNDPLYPPNLTTGITHQQKQWRTLRDNLAAVQATAIYHHTYANGYFPALCLATTAHPGARTTNVPTTDEGTIAKSTTFTNYPTSGKLKTDFLNGEGTNGWEFEPPASSESAFATEINDASSPLRRALTNLAHLAGDPDGAFPPLQEEGGTQVHPAPYLTMWGNFSELRRVMKQLENSTTYSGLSIADKSTLQTAACTLGMLAYNLENQVIEDKAVAGLGSWEVLTPGEIQTRGDFVINNIGGVASIGDKLYKMVDNYPSSTPPDPPADNIVSMLGLLQTNDPYYYDLNNEQPPTTYDNSDPDKYKLFYEKFAPEHYFEALKVSGGTPLPLQIKLKKIQKDIRDLYYQGVYSQVERDRIYGFHKADFQTFMEKLLVVTPASLNGDTYNWDKNTKKVTWYSNSSKTTIRGEVTTLCSPENFQQYSGGSGIANDQKKIGLALILCNPNVDKDGDGILDTLEDGNIFSPSPIFMDPKYPSLYYLFPKENHDRKTGQPGTEEYISQNDNDGNFQYKVLEDANVDNFGAIALQPKPRTSWLLPNTTSVTGKTINTITDNGQTVHIPFLDEGMMNGREMMSVRTLDLDLDLLRKNPMGSESWLPDSGIVYAFREDAVREDGIARPRKSGIGWTSCDTIAEIIGTNCRMNAVGATPQDPPINSDNNISPKPVDFYADPDRRPYGFRLRKGQDLRRIPAPPTEDLLNGLAFISDNPVYIVGDSLAFNLHAQANSCNASNLMQEFNEILNADSWNNFYTRSTLNPNYARIGDCWRVAEIIADAVSILSDTFVDGSIAEGITKDNVGNLSSYRNLNAPNPSSTTYWLRENGGADKDKDYFSPIKISRNGRPMICSGISADINPTTANPATCNNPLEYTGNYMSFNNGKDKNAPVTNTRINATIVSGLVPSRAQQSYGGLHNFPRFLENWDSRNLHISGALIQLSFSSYATAPFDQDSWEPGEPAQGAELINYYGAPLRRWGYDVGLQYAPMGPVAGRMNSPNRSRSEFYRELPINDPYICNLRKASYNSKPIDPNTGDCP